MLERAEHQLVGCFTQRRADLEQRAVQHHAARVGVGRKRVPAVVVVDGRVARDVVIAQGGFRELAHVRVAVDGRCEVVRDPLQHRDGLALVERIGPERHARIEHGVRDLVDDDVAVLCASIRPVRSRADRRDRLGEMRERARAGCHAHVDREGVEIESVPFEPLEEALGVPEHVHLIERVVVGTEREVTELAS
jgi:hypothetical protein